MIKQLFTALFAVTLIFAFSTVTFAQAKEAAQAKTEVKMKMKQKKMMKEEGKEGLMSLSCDPACGFKVVSKDEAEIVSMTKMHSKAHHQMDMADADIKKMIKPAGKMMYDGKMDKKMKEKKKEKMEKGMDAPKPDGK